MRLIPRERSLTERLIADASNVKLPEPRVLRKFMVPFGSREFPALLRAAPSFERDGRAIFLFETHLLPPIPNCDYVTAHDLLAAAMSKCDEYQYAVTHEYDFIAINNLARHLHGMQYTQGGVPPGAFVNLRPWLDEIWSEIILVHAASMRIVDIANPKSSVRVEVAEIREIRLIEPSVGTVVKYALDQ